MSTPGRGGVAPSSIVAFLICALFVAIVADLMQPIGPVILYLAATFLGVALAFIILSFVPPLRGVMRKAAVVAIVNLVVFGGFAGLQRYFASQPEGVEKGFVVAAVGPSEKLQNMLLGQAGKEKPPEPVVPVTPPPPIISASEKAMGDLTVSMASADPAERLRGAMAALQSPEPSLVAAAIDRLYRSGDPALRSLAIRQLLLQRKGARMPLLAVAATPDEPEFANALQAIGFTVTKLDETSGTFEGNLCAALAMSGAVNRSGVTITTRCKIAGADSNVMMTLQPTDDYRLAGEARNDQGESARIDLPLQ